MSFQQPRIGRTSSGHTARGGGLTVGINDGQKDFESFLDKFKSMYEAKREEIKKEKDAANNDFSAKRADDKIRKWDYGFERTIDEIKHEKCNLEDFSGFVQSVDSHGVVVVKHGKISYYLNINGDDSKRAVFASMGDKVSFSGVTVREKSISLSGLLKSPEWVVNATAFSNVNADGRIGRLAAYRIDDSATGDTLCSSINRLVSVLKSLEKNDFSYRYFGENGATPASGKFVDSTVTFDSIDRIDIDTSAQNLTPLLFWNCLVSSLIQFGYDAKNAKELYSYVLEKDGVKFYIPLYFGKQAFKSKDDEVKFKSIANKIADDNFAKGSKLKFTGEAKGFSFQGKQPVVFFNSDYRLHP